MPFPFLDLVPPLSTDDDDFLGCLFVTNTSVISDVDACGLDLSS